MFIFLRLLLAHFIGDFPLQFNFIFNLKLKGLHGVTLHALIIAGTSAILTLPYLHMPFLWFFIFFIFITHIVQDSIKIKYGVAKYSFWLYILDQLSHVGLISVVLLTGLKNLPKPDLPKNILTGLYLNDSFIIFFIFLILVTYNGYFLIRCFKDTFIERANYNNFEKWFGMFERAAILLIFISKLFLFLIPVVILRPVLFPVFKNKSLVHDNFSSLKEISLSWIIALIGSLFFILN